MTFFRKIATCALAAAALCSCSKKVTVIAVDEVFFTASVKTYITKASDSAFEDGDKVRIMAGSPIDETSVGTVTGGLISLDVPMRWIKGQKEATTFAAVYKAGGVVDVSSSLSYDLLGGERHDYQAHDKFLVAVQTAEPLKTVDLEFFHPFSKMVINITNHLSGDNVAKVEIDGVVMKGSVNIAEKTIELSGTKSKFDAVKLSSDKYAAVVMPQTAAPGIVVTTASGVVFHFNLESPFVFEGGAAYSADLTLDAETQPSAATFTFKAAPWASGGALDYSLVE